MFNPLISNFHIIQLIPILFSASSFVDQEKELENKQKLRAKKLNAVPLPEIDRKNKFPLPRERSNQMLPDYTRLDAEEAAKRGISEQMRIDFHTKRQYKALGKLENFCC